MAETRKSKEKKSKSKKGKKTTAVEQLRREEEQESARALMQLAQGSIEHARAPYQQTSQAAHTQPEAEDSQHQYGPDMTSQDIITRMSQEYSSDGKAKRNGKKEKKKRARKEVIEALDDLDAHDTKTLPLDQLSTPSGLEDQILPGAIDVSRRRSLQALDDSSTDDEVEGYQELTQPQQPAENAIRSSQSRPGESFENTQEFHPGLPDYSASQRFGGTDEAPVTKPTLKRKRQSAPSVSAGATEPTQSVDPTQTWVDQVADSQPPQQNGKGQYTFSPYFGALDASHQDRTDSADLFGQMQGSEMLIDPVLHGVNARSPSVERLHTQDLATVPARNEKHVSKKPRKRRRVDQLHGDTVGQGADDEEVPYYSPYATHERRGGPQDHSFLDRDNALQQGYPRLGSPLTVDPARSGRVANHQQQLEDLQGADKDSINVDQNGRSSKRAIKSNGTDKDHFGPTEIAKIEEFRDRYCEANNKTHRQFNDIIQSNIRSNPQAIALFKDIQDIFLTHRRSYVQRFCRRKFHNFSARGIWTPKEDEELRQAIAEKGTAWTTIGAMIERFPEDCRDRYRNYLANAQHRNREQWTDAEIVNLAGAIVDCMHMMKAERHRLKMEKYGHDVAMSDDGEEQDKTHMKLINWQAVSDRMGAYGGGRSRLQCSFKWNKLKEHDRRRYLRDIRESRRGLNALQAPNDNYTKSSGWRMKQASKKVANMLSGDRYDLLQAILHSGAPSEGNIPWRTIGEAWWQGKWTTTERKAGWLMMKQELPGSEEMDYRDIVYRLLTPLLQQDTTVRWDPSGYEASQQSQLKKKNTPHSANPDGTTRKMKGKGRAGERRAEEANMRRHANDIPYGAKSREYVGDSNDDDDNDGDGTYRPRLLQPDVNMFDPLPTPGRRRRSSRQSGGDAYKDKDGDRDKDEEGEGSVHSRNSLFDESDDGGQTGVGLDEGVSRELAGKVLALQHLS